MANGAPTLRLQPGRVQEDQDVLAVSTMEADSLLVLYRKKKILKTNWLISTHKKVFEALLTNASEMSLLNCAAL